MFTDGKATSLADGTLYQIKISAPKALSLNFGFDQFYLAKGAELAIYTLDRKERLGVFTEANNKEWRSLVTTLIHGDEVIVELFEPHVRKENSQVHLNRVSYGLYDIAGYYKGADEFGASGSCNININCDLGKDWQLQKKSVALIISGGLRLCTGTLLNNTQQDGRPLMLTADHCFENENPANWIFVFNYESPTCDDFDGPLDQTISGATTLVRNSQTDVGLVELSSIPPDNFDVFYSGWDATDSVPDSTTCIHHPSGDIKKISVDYHKPNITDHDDGAEDGMWQVLEWDEETTTEPGSSGSGLWDQNHRIVGQLYGGQAQCGNSVNDFYGRLNVSWDNGISSVSRLWDWLSPDDQELRVLDGYYPANLNIAYDVSMISVVSPKGGKGCEQSASLVCSFYNRGNEVVEKVRFSYQLNGGTAEFVEYTGSLEKQESALLTIDNIAWEYGQNTVVVEVVSINDVQVDEVESNNELEMQYELLNPDVVSVFPVLEQFNDSLFDERGWQISNPHENVTFEWTDTNQVGANGSESGCVIMTNYIEDNISGQSDFLISPVMDFSDLEAPITLDYYFAYAYYDAVEYYDSLIVSISTDCGLSWSRLYANGNSGMSTSGGFPIEEFFIPAEDHWENNQIDLSAFEGEEKVTVRFENKSNWGNNLYLDRIQVYDINTGNEAKEKGQVLIAPSPFRDLLTIQGEFYVGEKATIFDQAGRSILSFDLYTGTNQVKLPALPSGVYYIRLFEKGLARKLIKL